MVAIGALLIAQRVSDGPMEFVQGGPLETGEWVGRGHRLGFAANRGSPSSWWDRAPPHAGVVRFTTASATSAATSVSSGIGRRIDLGAAPDLRLQRGIDAEADGRAVIASTASDISVPRASCGPDS